MLVKDEGQARTQLQVVWCKKALDNGDVAQSSTEVPTLPIRAGDKDGVSEKARKNLVDAPDRFE
jgi:hypothetical protein